MTQDDEDDGDLHPAALYSGGSSSHQHHHHYHNHHRPFSSHARQSENQRQGNGLQVRTIITDSNGHSSRYENPVDSRGQLHRRGSSGYGTSATSVGGGCGGGASSGGGSGGGYSTTGSSSGSRRDSTKMSSSASSGGVGSGGSPINTGGKSSSKTERRPSKDRRLSSTSSDQSNQSLKAHEAPLLEVAGLSLKPGSGPSLHSRAASFKEHKPSNELHVDEAALIQARRNSMPTVTNNLLAVPTGGGGGEGGEPRETRLRRVRSFKTTSKGVVVNRGDSFKKKSTHSLMSTGSEIKDGDRNSRARSSSNNSALDLGSSSPTSPAYFRVNMMGAAGVGKTSLAQQFLTSEYIGHDDNDETHQMTVTVLLDGEESTIEFIDPPDRNVISGGVEQLMDAFVVVFAINEHASFEVAQNLVRFLRVDYGTDRAILLVANKIDLVRKRKVTADEARLVATTFDCKYVETSAALNHYVDELLVGIISQIRLQLSIPFTTIFFPGKEAGKRRKSKKPLCKGPRGFLNKLFRRGGFGNHGGKKDKAVDDLYTL